MKKLIGKKTVAFILTTIGIFSTTVINAQWINKASGFPTQRCIVELITVGDKAAWGVTGNTKIVKTTDGGIRTAQVGVYVAGHEFDGKKSFF